MPSRQTKVSGWHPEVIKARVRMTGVSLEQVSLAHSFSKGFLSAALKRPLFHAEQIIAKLIDVPAQEIWPDRYTVKGEPLHHGRHNSRKKSRAHLRLVVS